VQSPLSIFSTPWYNQDHFLLKEGVYMSDSKKNKKQTMARILALVIAGVMTLSVILAVILK